MKMLKSLFWKKHEKRPSVVTRVEHSSDGFTVWKSADVSEKVAWSEIERIFTYKVDCYAIDMIWLAFERKGHELLVHIPEEAEGFKNLIPAMNKALPGIDPEWYQNVMLPVFEEKLTLIFQRTQAT